MAISNIFQLTNGGGYGVSKPVSAGAGKAGASEGAEGFFKVVQGNGKQVPAAPGDSVAISKLAQALTGRAAEFFSHMDEKERGKLEELVKSGRVSVDDAVKGLQFWADETSFMKAMAKVPATQEEKDALSREEQRRAAFGAWGDAAGDTLREVERITQEYAEAQEKGTGNLQEISTRLEAAQKAHGEVISEMRSLHDRGGEARANVTLAFSRRFQIVAEAKAAAGHPDGAVMANPGDKAAADKLSEAGLGQGQLRNALRSYGAAVAAKADA